MGRLLLALALAVVSSCSCKKEPPLTPGPLNPERPYAPRPPPKSTPGRWDPEPPAVTAALALRSSDPARALELLLAEVKDAKRRGDPRAMAIAEHRAGDVALDLDRCDEAEAHYVEALEEHRARGDLKLVAVAANDLGLHGNACQKDPIAWFQLSVETREQLGDTEALRVGLANLGGAAMLWRPPAEARPILERALGLAESLGDVEGQRKVHVNLAATLMYLAIEPVPLDGGAGVTPAVAAERKLLGFQHLERALALGRQLGLGPEQGGCHGVPTDLWWMCGPHGLKVLADVEGDPSPWLEGKARAPQGDLSLAVGERKLLVLHGTTGFEVTAPELVEASRLPGNHGLMVKGLAKGEAVILLTADGQQHRKVVVVR